jgi:hypothetical protein
MEEVPIKNWISTPRKFEEITELDGTYEMVDKRPPNFKVDLFPHQRTIVKAALDLEASHRVDFDEKLSYLTSGAYAETSAGMITNEPGSGKSYMVLALVAINPEPRKITEISYIPFIKDTTFSTSGRRGRYARYDALHGEIKFKGWDMEVRRAYRKYIPTTLIFVGKQVLAQWKKYIEEHTTLTVFVIEDLHDLKTFYKSIFKSDDKNAYKVSYDVLLVKNGKISGSFEPVELKNTNLEGKRSKYIVSIFGELFKSYCFSRVVLDDFDTLEMPNSATVIPSRFTWFVSRTSCKKAPNDLTPNTYYSLSEHIFGNRSTYHNIWGNRHLLTTFNIRNDEVFVNQCMHVGQVSHKLYNVKNPNQQFINMVGALQIDNAREIMEMINGDALNTAADTLNIKSNSISDIFKKILGDNCSQYQRALTVEKYLVKVDEYLEEIEVGEFLQYHDYERNLHKHGPFKWISENVEFKNQQLMDINDKVHREIKEDKNKFGMAIDRVKSCIGDKECPLCAEEFEDEDVETVILQCCGLVICGFCVGRRIDLNVARNNADITSTCPRCKNTISFGALIFVSKNIDLNDIMNDKIDVEEEKVVEEVQLPPPEKKDLSKKETIIEIINDRTSQGKDINVILNGVATSDEPLGEANYHKYLVVAQHAETLIDMEQAFTNENVKWARLRGTAKQISQMVDKYDLPFDDPDSINILLLDGATYCSGLNLQITTDIIFMHQITDENVKIQLLGRAIRIGRHNDLVIHWVLYENSERI